MNEIKFHVNAEAFLDFNVLQFSYALHNVECATQQCHVQRVKLKLNSTPCRGIRASDGSSVERRAKTFHLFSSPMQLLRHEQQQRVTNLQFFPLIIPDTYTHSLCLVSAAVRK